VQILLKLELTRTEIGTTEIDDQRKLLMQLPGQITDRDVPKTATVLDRETPKVGLPKNGAEVASATTNVVAV